MMIICGSELGKRISERITSYIYMQNSNISEMKQDNLSHGFCCHALVGAQILQTEPHYHRLPIGP